MADTVTVHRKFLEALLLSRAATNASLNASLFPPIAPFSFKRKYKAGHKVGVNIRKHVTFDSVTSFFNEEDFRGAFRMSRKVFEKLLGKVRPFWSKSGLAGMRSKRGTVPVDIRLAITLRILAGAKMWDLMGFFHVKKSTVDKIFSEGIDVLDKVLKWPSFPTSMDELHRYAMDFKLSRKPPSPFIGALDGIAVKIRKPVEMPSAELYCRKGFYALAGLSLVDAHYRFLFMSCLFPGATHDSVAYRASALWRFIEKNKDLLREFWIVCDEVFRSTEFLITNYPSFELDDDKSAFNFFLAKLRNHVEQAFGMLVAKWMILESPLKFRIKKCIRIVAVCMRLHNFCIEEKADGDSLRHWMKNTEFRAVYQDTIRWHKKLRQMKSSAGQEDAGEEGSGNVDSGAGGGERDGLNAPKKV